MASMLRAASRLAPVFTKTMVEGVEGVHMGISGMAPNTAVWMYRVGDTLVDTGAPNHARWVRQYLRKLAAQGVKVSTALATHHHEDHAGNGKLLQEEFGMQVMAPEQSTALLREGFHLEWYRRVVWGKPAPYSASPAPAALTATVDTADPVAGASAGTYTLKLIHAPGHCPDHHVVYVPETGWLFAADLFVTARPSMARFDEDVLAGIRTLESILQDPTMELSTLFCAHRGPIDDATAALTSRLEHLLSVRTRLLRGWADDPDLRTGVQGLTTSVLGREGPLRFISQGDFSKLHLARGLLGGYDRAAATRASIGSLSPSEAVAYLEGSGLAGPGAISALDIANPKWLAEHRLYIQDGVSLGQTPRIPGTGLDHRGRGQPGGVPGPKPGIAAVGVSPAAAHAAAARGALSAALPSQPPPARLTMRDAQQSHKSAVDQSPIFHHAKAEPRRGASLVSQQGRVLMPDGSMNTAEAAASAMAEASVSRQEFRFAERARALQGTSPIGSAYAKQVRASLPSEDSAPLLEKGGHRKDST